ERADEMGLGFVPVRGPGPRCPFYVPVPLFGGDSEGRIGDDGFARVDRLVGRDRPGLSKRRRLDLDRPVSAVDSTPLTADLPGRPGRLQLPSGENSPLDLRLGPGDLGSR